MFASANQLGHKGCFVHLVVVSLSYLFKTLSTWYNFFRGLNTFLFLLLYRQGQAP